MTTKESTNAQYRPKFIEFATEEERLQTFADWPRQMKQKPGHLADAGFFYMQMGDRVMCFCCGGGLNNWEASDDPWEQHIYWYENCPYVQLMRTPKYIKSVRKKFKKTTEKGDNENDVNGKPQNTESGVDCEEINASLGKLSLKKWRKTGKPNDSRLCRICCNDEYNAVFLPCGHVIACAKCASTQTKCPVCREPLQDIKRIYMTYIAFFMYQ